MKIYLNLIVIATIIFGHLPVYSQDSNPRIWPNFRGVNCTGVADSEQSPPVNFNKEQNLQWMLELPEGHSSPCVWDDKIFITGVETESKILKMYCIESNKGLILWEKNIEIEDFERIHHTNNHATATPATDGENVIFYFSSYGLLCYDYNGKLKWKRQLPVPKTRHGMGCSPIIAGDLVLLNCFGDLNDARLVAIDKNDGTTRWKKSLSPILEGKQRDSYSTPVVYKNQVIIYASDYVAGYDLMNGERVWCMPTGLTDAVCTPVIGNDVLYTISFSTMGNSKMRAQFPQFKEFAAKYDINKDSLIGKDEITEFSFLMYPDMPEVPGYDVPLQYVFGWWDKNKDSFIDSLEWKDKKDQWRSNFEKQGLKAIKLGEKGELELNNYVWGYVDDVSHVCSPLLFKNRVYMVEDGGVISCFHAETGKLLYQEKLGASGGYFASPIAAGGKIYTASRSGMVTVLLAGDKYEVLAKNDIGDLITATPAVVDNKLFLRTNKALYAFGN